MRNKKDGITLTLTPGEAFTVQEALRTASAVHDAQQPEDGDGLRQISAEAAAYTEHRDSRVRSVSNRLGRAYAAHIRDRVSGATSASGRTRSAKAKGKKPAKPKTKPPRSSY